MNQSTAPGVWDFDLRNDRVDVWSVRLTPGDEVARIQPLLSSAEAAQAERFQSRELQDSFILSRGALRVLLGSYLGTSASAIEFSYGPKGKPSVGATLKFNTSHSGGLALYAFTIGCEVGVDVEHIRPRGGLQEIAQRFFSAEEAAELNSLPESARLRAFYSCWTRKEAYIKAIGEGLSASLGAFQVTVRRGKAARFVRFAHDPSAAAEWVLHDLDVGISYAAALAYRAAPRRLRIFAPVDPNALLALT